MGVNISNPKLSNIFEIFKKKFKYLQKKTEIFNIMFVIFYVIFERYETTFVMLAKITK